MDHDVMNGQTDKWTRWIIMLPLIHHRRYKYNNSNSPHWFLAATKKFYEWWSLSASIPVWHTCASALSGWVLYRQLELTKLTRPDLHHVVGLFILRDVHPSVYPSHLFHYRRAARGPDFEIWCTPPPPTHLVCHVCLIANFLSFHMSLVVVVNCGAGNALRGFEIGMF